MKDLRPAWRRKGNSKPRFYDPTKGKIFPSTAKIEMPEDIDAYDHRIGTSLRDYRKQIAAKWGE